MHAARPSHQQPDSSSAANKRGVKRLADESNDDQLRFTKRFNLLSLGKTPVRGFQVYRI
jgi:hypothetical protein